MEQNRTKRIHLWYGVYAIPRRKLTPKPVMKPAPKPAQK